MKQKGNLILSSSINIKKVTSPWNMKKTEAAKLGIPLLQNMILVDQKEVHASLINVNESFYYEINTYSTHSKKLRNLGKCLVFCGINIHRIYDTKITDSRKVRAVVPQKDGYVRIAVAKQVFPYEYSTGN